jgi:UDP-N-acetyl-D-glucosamine dehydrogenase
MKASRLARFIQRVEEREARIAVVGLGYVGLPVALSFAEAGFQVTGIDLDKSKVSAIRKGSSYLEDVPSDRLARQVELGKLKASSSFAPVKQANAVIVCVPTPLADGAPDLSRVLSAGEAIALTLKAGALVVLESTTYPGTTDELLQPLLESGGLTGGEDFFLAFSPERIDPGNELYEFGDIPKVVGGIDADSGEAAAALYGQVVPKVITLASSREAELTKLLENTFRHVNIALVNELAVYANEMGIDIWECIGAAATKPFGFMPFYPGPGWGGHCIPLDPTYLSWRVRRDRAHEVRFVELAQAVNSEMPRHVVERISLLLNDRGKAIKDARIMGIGVAYKRGVADTRESPALKILARLSARGAQVSYHDPFVPELRVGTTELASEPLSRETIEQQDLIVILIPQQNVDWDAVVDHAGLIFDCCNAVGRRHPSVVRL